MYESFFQLRHRPFAAAPSPSRYVSINPIEQARQTLIRCIDRAEGPGLIVGASGIGKTLLCQLLAQQFQGRFQVASLQGGRLGTRRALLQNILFELRLPYRDMDEGELRLSLIDHLSPRDENGEGLLLLVDEAHLLPLRLLDEIRLLTNLVQHGQPKVQLVLAGGPAIEERLANPKLDSLQQRIAARCYLQPFHRDETINYIQQQIEQAGGDASRLMTADAMQGVHSATDGIPRLINQVCDHALVLASLAGTRQITLPVIQEAWADLQQLPAPWHEAIKASMTQPEPMGEGESTDIIEFGPLDEPSVKSSAKSAASAEHELERLDRSVTALADDFEGAPRYQPSLSRPMPGDFHPADESTTELELVFPSGFDPFGGNWEEEEVVIDRYASLEATAVSHRPRVMSSEGQKIGSALAAIDGDRQRSRTSHRRETAAFPESTKPAAVVELANKRRPVVEADTDFNLLMSSFDLDPASDPVMPEAPTSTMHSAPPMPMSLHDIADDRDIIVIEEGNAAPLRAKSPREPKKQDYRRLFSNLRNRVR